MFFPFFQAKATKHFLTKAQFFYTEGKSKKYRHPPEIPFVFYCFSTNNLV